MAAPIALVTGAGGFIGRALVRRLHAEDVLVRALVRGRRPSLADDIVVADLTTMARDAALVADVDVIYHLAAKTHDLADGAGVDAEYEHINVEGTRRLLECVRGHRVRRMVYVSSVKAIGEGGDARLEETAPPQPTTPYGRSKLAAERLVQAAAARDGFEAVCIRFPLVYGTGQHGNLQRLIAAIARHRFPPPPANRNRRSMVHVENAVDALRLAGAHPRAAAQVYTVTDERPYSTREIYDAIRAALGRPPLRWAVPDWVFALAAATGDVARSVVGRRVGFDSDARRKLLGSAWYSGDRIVQELGYRASRDLIGSVPALVADVRSSPAP